MNVMPVQISSATSNSQIKSLPERLTTQLQATRPALSRNGPSDNARNQTFVYPPPSSHPYMSILTPCADEPQQMSHTSTPYVLSSSPLRHIHAENHNTMLLSSGGPLHAAQSIPRISENTHQLPQQNQFLPTGRQESQFNPVGINIAGRANQANLSASLPASSFSASSTGLTQRHEGADGHPQKEGTQSVLASLIDTSIYELPTSTLERVVGEVIREDGFISLVSSRIKHEWISMSWVTLLG